MVFQNYPYMAELCSREWVLSLISILPSMCTNVVDKRAVFSYEEPFLFHLCYLHILPRRIPVLRIFSLSFYTDLQYRYFSLVPTVSGPLLHPPCLKSYPLYMPQFVSYKLFDKNQICCMPQKEIYNSIGPQSVRQYSHQCSFRRKA